jgi:hypothetical protein
MMIALPLAAQQGSDLDKRITEKLFAKAFGNATAETRYAIGSISK